MTLSPAKLLGLQPGDARRVAPLTAMLCIVMMSLYVLKPARNALFLNREGAAQLPYVLMLVALVGGVAAAAYARLSDGRRTRDLILVGFPFLALNLVGFWFLLPIGATWTTYLFYIWVNLYGLIATSLVWLLANAAFDAREARRVFGVIGSGGIAGAILGGAITRQIAELLGTENLLLVCVGLIASCVLLLRSVRVAEVPQLAPRSLSARSKRTDEEPTSTRGALGAIKSSELLKMLVPAALLMAMVSAIVDVQFNTIVEEAFPTKDAKTAFFGEFFAYLNAFAIAFQLFITPRLLKGVGVGLALMLLPLALALGSGAVLVMPGLVAAIAVKSADGGLRHSLHKSATEILFVPIPADVKQRAKVLLDATLDNIGTGIGALLVLAVTALFDLGPAGLGGVALALTVVWMLTLVRLRSAYLDAFRAALERHSIEPEELRVRLADASALEHLVGALDGKNERQVIYALDMLRSAPANAAPDRILPLLDHASADVRRKALDVLQSQGDARVLRRANELLDDEAPEVRAAALFYVCTHGAEDGQRTLQRHLDGPDPKLRAAAVACVAEHGEANAATLLNDEFLEDVLQQEGGEGAFMRRELARALASVRLPNLESYLSRLSRDSNPEVASVAIESIGQAGLDAHIPWLIVQLGLPERRRAARHALAALGKESLPALEKALADEKTNPQVRLNVPRVFVAIPSQLAVDALLRRLQPSSPSLRLRVLKALNKLRDSHPELSYGQADLEAVLVDEARWYSELSQVLNLMPGPADAVPVSVRPGRPTPEPDVDPALALLSRAVEEKRQQSLERVFRTLGLMHSQHDIYNAYLAVVSGNRALRANALEFLDNVLARDLKSYVLPFSEATTLEQCLLAGEALFGPRLMDLEPALMRLLTSGDFWLRSCVLFSLRGNVSESLRPFVERAADDPHPVVQETARVVLAA